MKHILKDISSLKFGKWTVIKRDNCRNNNPSAYWYCICDCGNNASIAGFSLRLGKSTQCTSCRSKIPKKNKKTKNKIRLIQDKIDHYGNNYENIMSYYKRTS